jgi:hypothetical protein
MKEKTTTIAAVEDRAIKNLVGSSFGHKARIESGLVAMIE